MGSNRGGRGGEDSGQRRSAICGDRSNGCTHQRRSQERTLQLRGLSPHVPVPASFCLLSTHRPTMLRTNGVYRIVFKSPTARTGKNCNRLQPDLWLRSYEFRKWTSCSSPESGAQVNRHRTGWGRSRPVNAPPTTTTVTPTQTPTTTTTRTTVTTSVRPALQHFRLWNASTRSCHWAIAISGCCCLACDTYFASVACLPCSLHTHTHLRVTFLFLHMDGH